MNKNQKDKSALYLIAESAEWSNTIEWTKID